VNYELGRFTQVFAVMLAGGVLGVGSALFAVDLIYKTETETNGSWRAAPPADTVSENRWVRTATALSGTWLPAGGRVREWTALRDSQGERLTSECAYYLLGKPETESIWSITLYDNDHALPATARNSAVSSDLSSDSRGQIQIQAGGPDQGGDWLPAESGPFTLTLRDYGVTSSGRDSAGDPPFFSIHRGECQ
jgi:hypothetical protein